jgi:uncharacterized protein YciI
VIEVLHFGEPVDAGRSQMKHFVMIYEFVHDYESRREPFRAEHLALARASAERDQLQLGGRLVDEATGLLLFKAESAAVAEAFAASDPYVINGVVHSYRVREWTTVVGRDALTKLPI